MSAIKSEPAGSQRLRGSRDLKAFTQRSDLPGLIHLFWWCVVLGCTGTLVHLAVSKPTWLLPAMFIHGIVVVHHFALQHECTHYTAFKSRGLCRFLMRACGFLLVIPPLFFRYEHSHHHRYTNQPGKDPELIALPGSRWEYLRYLSAVPYWRSQVGGLLRRSFGRFTEEEKRFVLPGQRAVIVREGRWMLAGYTAIALLMLIFQWSAPLLYWIFPMLLGEPVMRFIRMTEHVGRPTVADFHVNTRTNLVSWPWRWLAWNMNYHAEHHYATAVPFHALGRLHEHLKGQLYVEPHGYTNAHRDIVRRIG